MRVVRLGIVLEEVVEVLSEGEVEVGAREAAIVVEVVAEETAVGMHSSDHLVLKTLLY